MLKYHKINFGYEMYLNTLPSKLRNILTKLRLSSHKLRIELDRYNRNGTPREIYIVFYVMLTMWKMNIIYHRHPRHIS